MNNAWTRDYAEDGEPLMFPAEVAAILRVTARHVTRMAEKGRLPIAARTNTGFRYRIGDVIEMACREVEIDERAHRRRNRAR